MNCPKCGGLTSVIDTEKFSMYVWRRRCCIKCGFRVNTHENFVDDQKAARTKKPKEEPPQKATVTPLPVRNTRKQIEDIRDYLELRKREREDE